MTPEEIIKPEGTVRMVFENIEVSPSPFLQNKIVYKAMGKYGENLATAFARFISREGYMKISNSVEWIKISAPHPSVTLEHIYKLFIEQL